MHWFQFLRLTDQENIYSPGMKNRKMLSKKLFFATSTDFRCKRHFYKRVTNASLHRFYRLFVPWLWIRIYWPDFYVADTYTRGDDSVIIYPKVNALSSLFCNPLAITKWHCRDTPDSELADIDILRICIAGPSLKKFFLQQREKKVSNPISIISNDVFIFQWTQF